VLPALVVVQMVRVAVGDGDELRARGVRQAESVVDLPAQRGAILDRAGRALAVNTARFEIAADPTAPGFSDRADTLYTVLGDATGRGAAHFRQRVADRASRQYVVLVRDLDEASKERLDAARVPGLIVTGSYRRHYNYGETAAHVLGHVTRDLDGVAGIELQLDDVLQGTAGRQAVQRDRRGVVRAVVGGTRVEPVDGEDVVLTVDLVRQAILEEELARGVQESGATWGTAVAMDPRTGAILAMANAPTYDPNRAGEFSEAAKRNHAVVDRIEPGSTFKLVTAVAALESGTADPQTVFDTGNGSHTFHGRTMRDSHANGRITLTDALAQSSNVAMALAAERMGRGPLYRTARGLGFGQPTTVDLPGEVAGALPRPDTWSALTLPWMSTGYGLEATPLQILTAYAALANGGLLVRPHVVAERRDARTGEVVWTAPPDSVRRAFSAATARALLPAFERVVSEDGTARTAQVEGLRIAGKTGTAKTASGGTYSNRYRASFVGLFPAEAPEVVLLVLLDSPVNGYYGGTVSAPIFGRVARRWIGTFPLVAQRVAPSAPVPARDAARVPSVAGMPGRLAAGRLRAEGFPVRLDDDAFWQPVALRDHRAGARVPLADALRLDAPAEAAPARRTMPDLRGQSVRTAVAWLRALGVQPTVSGSGAVRAQSVAAGRPLPRQVALTGQRPGRGRTR
jgi:cell division protein FtsI (penicillin-binding protein 3)